MIPVDREAREQWAVLLDLDETLVLTGALEQLRQKRNWSQVYANFGRTQLPTGTVRFIDQVRSMARIAVVTKSPRPYAERILKFHGLNIPVAVAYHDVARHKPHPEALIKAAATLEISIERCIYIGDHVDDVAAARAARCFSVELCWTGNPSSASICTTWDSVYERIVSIIGCRNGEDLQ